MKVGINFKTLEIGDFITLYNENYYLFEIVDINNVYDFKKYKFKTSNGHEMEISVPAIVGILTITT